MSRKIKFSIWDSDQGRILPVITMYYDEYGRQWFGFQRSEAGPEPATMEYCEAYNGDPTVSVMQFTGLYDKNGREIYEGDICRTHDWHKNEDGSKTLSDANKYYRNVVIEYRAQTPLPGYAIHDWYEVIGNIYENPELLE